MPLKSIIPNLLESIGIYYHQGISGRRLTTINTGRSFAPRARGSLDHGGASFPGALAEAGMSMEGVIHNSD
jgi:hypothetical protein